MIFVSDASKDGKLIHGHEGWHWSRNKGHYHNNRDFFWIHWEIGERAPNAVKLHVECPKAEIDPELNVIKCELVKEFLAARFKDTIERRGYVYKVGRLIKPEHAEGNKCTSPFHVVLSPEQQDSDSKKNIETVNSLVAEELRAVIEKFRERIDQEF